MSSEATEDLEKVQAKQKAEEEVKRQAAEEEVERKAAEEEVERQAAEKEVKWQAAEKEVKRKAAEEEVKRQAAEEAVNLQAAQAAAKNMANNATPGKVTRDSRVPRSARSKALPYPDKEALKNIVGTSHAKKTRKDNNQMAPLDKIYDEHASGQGPKAATNAEEDTDVVMGDDVDIEQETWQNAPQDPYPQDPHSEQTLQKPDEDDEGPASYTTCNREESENPRGSKTVAWGRRGHSTFYINRKGPAASGYHWIESQPIFEKGGTIDWRKSPPDELCVSNIENRLGELKFGNTYVHKDIHGIYGVAFRAKLDKTFPSCMIPKGHEYELLNHDNYQEWECTHGRKPRFVPCYVRVGWKTADGQIVKSWELRRALQVPVRWGPEKTDDAVYQLAKFHYKRQMEAEGKARDNPEDYPSSRDPTPAYPAPHHRQPLSPPIQRWGSHSGPTIDIRPSVEDPRHHHQPPATSYRSTSRELTPETRPRSQATTPMVSQNGPSQEQSDVDAAIETYKQMYLDEHNASSIFKLPAKAKSDLLMTILDFKKSVNV
ncbi:hypothetical protein M011DRAFT_472886 [Sporormia fimetaria CBS 119925]|uniref:Uncharacterized protein n=1 Tax=Sporormia fimetaria CBS 119925 TaxID=1340428 RepID=A0A6A6UW03_9PLEO|nr:hypothetical protein M011DRAFT_472886 [Sporormia fimetaria CBS 119925]